MHHSASDRVPMGPGGPPCLPPQYRNQSPTRHGQSHIPPMHSHSPTRDRDRTSHQVHGGEGSGRNGHNHSHLPHHGEGEGVFVQGLANGGVGETGWGIHSHAHGHGEGEGREGTGAFALDQQGSSAPPMPGPSMPGSSVGAFPSETMAGGRGEGQVNEHLHAHQEASASDAEHHDHEDFPSRQHTRAGASGVEGHTAAPVRRGGSSLSAAVGEDERKRANLSQKRKAKREADRASRDYVNAWLERNACWTNKETYSENYAKEKANPPKRAGGGYRKAGPRVRDSFLQEKMWDTPEEFMWSFWRDIARFTARSPNWVRQILAETTHWPQRAVDSWLEDRRKQAALIWEEKKQIYIDAYRHSTPLLDFELHQQQQQQSANNHAAAAAAMHHGGAPLPGPVSTHTHPPHVPSIPSHQPHTEPPPPPQANVMTHPHVNAPHPSFHPADTQESHPSPSHPTSRPPPSPPPPPPLPPPGATGGSTKAHSVVGHFPHGDGDAEQMALGETAPPSPPLAVIPEREPSDTSAGPRGNGHKETGVPPAFSSSSSSNSGSGQETRQNGSSVSALPSSPTRIMKQEEAARGGSAAASAHRERGRDEDTRMQDVSGDRGGVTVPLSVHPQHQSSADYPAAAAASSGTPFHHHGGGQGGPFAHQHPPPQPNGHPPPHLLHAHAAGGGGAVPFHSMYPQPQQQQVSDQMYMDPDHQSVHGPGGDPNGYGGSGHFQLIDLLPPGVADVRNRLHEGHDWFGDGLPPWIPLGDEGRRAVRKGIAEVLRGPHAALGRELIKEMIPTGAWADAQVPVLGQLAIRMGHYKLLVETTAAFMERYLAHGGTGGNMNVKEGETGDGMGVHGGMGLGAMPEMEERNPHITQMQMQMRAGRDGNSIPGPGAENSASASSASSSSSSSSAGAIRDPDPSGRGPGMNGVGLKKRARGGAGGGEDSSVGVGESIDGSRGGKRLQTTGQTDVEEEVHMGGEGDVYGSHVHSHGMPGPLQHGEVGGPLSGVGGMGMGLGPAGEWMMIEGGQEETPRSFALQLTAIGGVEGGGVSVGSAGRGELLCLSPGFRPSSPLQYQQGGVPMHHHASHGLSPHSHSGGRSGRGGGAIRGRRGGRGGGTGGSGPSSAGVLNGPPGGASSSSSSSSSTPDGNAVRGGNANADAPPLQVPIPHASERDGDALFDLNLGLGHAHNSQLGPISMPLHGHITPSTTLHRQMQMQMVPVWPHAVSSQAPLSSLDGGTGPHAMEFGFSERGGDMDMGTVPSGLDGHPELTALSAGGEGEGEEEEGPPRVGREGLRPRQQRQKQSQEHSGGVSSPSVNGGSRVGGKRGRGQTSMSILSPASDILPSGGLTDFLSPVNGLPPSHPFPSASPSSPHEALAQAVSSSSSSPRRPRRGGGEQGEGAQGGAAFASASPSRGPGNSKEIEGAGGPASRTRSHDASSDPPHGGGQGTRPSQQAQGGRGAQVQEETEVRSGHGESLSGGSRGTRGGRGGRGGRAGGASSTSHTHAQGSHSVSSSQQQRQQPSSPSPSALTTGDEGAGRRVTRASRRQAA